jgi:hypothetical protein
MLHLCRWSKWHLITANLLREYQKIEICVYLFRAYITSSVLKGQFTSSVPTALSTFNNNVQISHQKQLTNMSPTLTNAYQKYSP